MQSIRLGPGAEFDLIRRVLDQDRALRTRIGLDDDTGAPVLVGPGDDCAVVYGTGIAVSVDLSVEDVHFRRAWLDPEEIGYRAASAALSDIAAVAAVPIGLLASIALPAGVAGGRLMQGVSEAGARHGAMLLGGDVSRSPGPLVLDITALGQTGAPVLRSGAEPGDEIWVTGRLGAAAAAVAAWEEGRMPDPAARAAFARPAARIAEARWLAERGALHALIDLSDGLAGDARHLAAASAVRILLDLDAVPVHEAAVRTAGTPEAALALALGGGEDYELCFAAPAGTCGPLVAQFRAFPGVELTCIGRVEPGEGVFVHGKNHPDPRPLEMAGFSHAGLAPASDAESAPPSQDTMGRNT